MIPTYDPQDDRLIAARSDDGLIRAEWLRDGRGQGDFRFTDLKSGRQIGRGFYLDEAGELLRDAPVPATIWQATIALMIEIEAEISPASATNTDNRPTPPAVPEAAETSEPEVSPLSERIAAALEKRRRAR